MYPVPFNCLSALAKDELLVAWNNGLITPDLFAKIRADIKAADDLFRKTTAETTTTDTWPIMRVKIVGFAGNLAITTAVNDPKLQVELIAVSGMVQNILGVVQ